MDGNTHTLSEVIKLIVKQNHLNYGLQKASLPALWNELMGSYSALYYLGRAQRQYAICATNFACT